MAELAETASTAAPGATCGRRKLCRMGSWEWHHKAEGTLTSVEKAYAREERGVKESLLDDEMVSTRFGVIDDWKEGCATKATYRTLSVWP